MSKLVTAVLGLTALAVLQGTDVAASPDSHPAQAPIATAAMDPAPRPVPFEKTAAGRAAQAKIKAREAAVRRALTSICQGC